VKEIDVGIDAREKEKGAVSGDLLTPAQESKHQSVLQSSSSFSADKEQLFNAEQELANYRGQRADARRILNEKTQTHINLTTTLSELRGQYECSRQALSGYKEMKVAADRQTVVKSRMAVLEAKVVKPMPGDPDAMDWGDLEFKKASSIPLKEQLSTWKFFLDSFGQQAESIRCPTCFQEVGSDYIKEVSNQYPVVKDRFETLDLDIQFQEGERRRITGEFMLWKQKMVAAQTELQTLGVQLSTAPIVDLPDEANLNGMDQFCKSFESTEKLRLELEQQIAVNTEREKNMFNAETNAAMNVDKLRQRLAKEPKVEEVSKAQQVLAAHASARTVIARADGSLEQLRMRRTQVTLMLTQREVEEAKLDGIKTYRNLCERARTVLHRDNLPNMVAQAYMQAINAHLYQYLETFEVPYQARMMEDTSILCNFGGTEVPAERLSGGQKVALGLTWRFAVHNMFVNNLGMMFLDEPTVYLDKDRIDSVYRLLERVKSYSKAAGLQVIVVTHEERLAGVFDQVINL
jgi:energy-coupling factor transporter ATP-binding protein EcfA2